MTNTKLRLTQTVKKGGCAAKIEALELRKILANINFPPKNLALMVDGAHFDDAAVLQISPEVAIVQTLDFFTPIVDSPALFGKIAAANALSDVYAMGGIPQTAMAILAFPLATFGTEIITEVLQGACDTLRLANTSLCGGHSIDDDTLKFGLSVTGTVHPKNIWTNANAKIGDKLIMTKPLGTGAATAALKKSLVVESDLEEVLANMTQLNSVLDIIPADFISSINAATDITGFGLLGHAMQMAKASAVSFEFEFNKIPVFNISTWALNQGCLTKAHASNRDYVKNSVQLEALSAIDELFLVDPQTSGGLLLSVDSNSAEAVLKNLQTNFLRAEIIGTVEKPSQYSVTVE